MKVTCILTSYNRPTLVRQSIASIAAQTHQDYELIVVDESTVFDIEPVLAEFKLGSVTLIRQSVTAEQRKSQNRLSVNVNAALRVAKGDLVCFLADDDYYFLEWFERAVVYFRANPSIGAAYGKLVHSHSMEMVFPGDGKTRFPGTTVSDPYCVLDHNQMIHRRIDPPVLWPEDISSLTAPDGLYGREVGKRWAFHPIDAFAAVKRLHGKNLQQNADKYRAGKLEETRE